MKTEHTAGPWSCNLGNGTNLTHSPDVWSGSRVVAVVGDAWASTYQAEDIANGRLIASAPALLEALETLLESSSKRAVDVLAAQEQAHAAIRRARGIA